MISTKCGLTSDADLVHFPAYLVNVIVRLTITIKNPKNCFIIRFHRLVHVDFYIYANLPRQSCAIALVSERFNC